MKVKFTKKDILTIPNALTLFRIILIPFLIVSYVKNQDYKATILILVLSGITDVADGFVARKFNMISEFGKFFDPVADKLTQASIALCLWTRFPHMIYLFVLMAIKEIIMFTTGYMSLRSSGKMPQAVWHGKVNTVLIYTVMLVHIFWYNISRGTSDILLFIVVCTMILSLILYARMNIKNYKSYKEKHELVKTE